MRSVLAVDIGGTKIAMAAMTEGGVLRARKQIATPRDPNDAIDVVTTTLRAIADEAGVAIGKEPVTCGVACPGPLSAAAGVVGAPPNLPAWHGFDLRAALSSALGVPVHVENDANAATIAEARFGGHGVDNLVYVTISTGIGGGAFLDGRLVRGSSGNAVEIGHVSVKYDGWECVCGNRGCVEAFASGPAVLKRAIAAGFVDDTATTADVLAKIEARDRRAVALWDETLDVLAAAFSSTLATFDPLLIVVGGGFALASWKLLHKPLEKRMRARAMTHLRARSIVKAKLGDDAALVGAGCVALDGGVDQ